MNIKDLTFEREAFYIVFDGLDKPKIWDIFYKIIKWCDSYTSFSLVSLEINKDLVHYSLIMGSFLTDVKWIYVSVSKPSHRLDYESKQIKIFKEVILKKFQRHKPRFTKKHPEEKEVKS